MTWQTVLYFSSILLTCVLTGFLAWYAWKHRHVPGSSAYAWLALSECLLALTEILSVLSPSMTSALFWFRTRYPIGALIAVFWLVFAIEYSGHREWISKRLLAGIFVVPLVTQILLWSNSLHGLWMKQEAALYQIGRLWIADISSRIPELGYLTHSFYNLFLTLAGIALMLLTAWGMRRELVGQALILAGAGLTALFFVLNSLFGLLPKTEFNIFTPGIGLSVLLIALAVFRFDFLKRAPAQEDAVEMTRFDTQEKYSLAGFILIFILFTSGLAAASYVTYQNYEEQFRALVDSQLGAIASLKADELQDWRDEHLAHADLFYHNENFSEWVRNYLEDPQDAEAQAKLLTWMEKIKAFPEYDRIFLLDIQGVERLSLPADPEAAPAELVEQASASLASGQVVFLDFHRHSESDAVHLSMLVPIYDAQDNQPLGVLVLRIDPNVYLYPFIQRWPVPSASAETLLIRQDGEEVVYLNSLRFQPDTALNLRFSLADTQLPAVNAVLGQTGIVEGLDYRNILVFADIRAVPDSLWFLVSKMDRAEVYAPLRSRLWQTILFFGTWVLAAGAGLLLSWRQQRVRFYRRQLEAAEEVRASEEKFRLAFETSPDSVAITRVKDGMFVSVNKGFEQITGYLREEVIGKNSLEINIWKDPADRRKIVEGLQARGEVRDYEAPFLTREGEIVGLMSAVIIELNGEPHILNIVRDITERKQAEDALRESRAILQAALDNSPAGIAIADAPDGKLRYVNNAGLLIRGGDRQSIVEGIGIDKYVASWQLLDLDGRPLKSDEVPLARAVLFGETNSREFIVRRTSDDDRIVLGNAAPIMDERGKITAGIVIFTDITERKQAQDALLQSENLLNKIFDVLPVGIWLADKNGQLIRSNQIGREIWGAEPLVGQEQYGVFKARRFPSGEELASEDWALARTIKEGVTVLDEMLEIDSFDGKKKVILNFTAPVFDAAGNVEAAVIINLDITERKRAEEALRASEEKFHSYIQYAPDGVFISDEKGNYVEVNSAACHITGYSEDELLKLSIPDLLFAEDLEIGLQHFKNVNDKGFARNEIGFVTKSGEKRFWNVAAVKLSDTRFLGFVQDTTERKRAEEELKQSQALSKTIIDSIPGTFYMIDASGKYVGWNAYQRDEIVGQPESLMGETYAIDTIHLDDRRIIGEKIENVLKNGAEEVVEGRVLLRGGPNFQWLLMTGTRVMIKDSPVLVGIGIDITKRKRVEEALLQVNERLALAQSLAGAGIWDWDLATGKLNWTPEFFSLFGLDPTTSDATFDIWRGALHPDDIQSAEQRINEAIRDHVPLFNEYRIVTPSGELRWIGAWGDTTYNERGEALRMTGLCIDITERKQTEAALHESEARFRQMFENHDAVMLLIEPHSGLILDANRSASKFYGYEYSKLCGMNINEINLLSPEQVADERLSALSEERNYFVFPHRLFNGEERIVEVHSSPITFKEKQVLFSIIHDITERRQAQEQLIKTLEELKRSNAELEQFAYVASHDLQEPLRAVAGMVQLLQKRYQGQLDERADEYIRLAVDGASRMQTLIKDLLAYSRIERHGNPIKAADVNKTLKSALRNLESAIAEQGAVVTSENLPTLNADAPQLTQLFQNLIGNAIKFHGTQQPQVHVGVEKLADAWRFSVRDNGIGIEPQYFERVFLVFQRLHTHNAYSGTGIGLSICKKIVERHGGRIWIDSQFGQGSTFYFTIPHRS